MSSINSGSNVNESRQSFIERKQLSFGKSLISK